MELLRRIYDKLGRILQVPDVKHRPIYNINLDITRKQRRVAFVYSNSDFYEPYREDKVVHANSLSVYPKLKYFIDKDYVIDLYECRSTAPVEVSGAAYNIVFGFGKLYAILCKRNPHALKILYITENAPWAVEKKFKERLSYYEERHGRVDYTVRRNGFYTQEMFELSDVGIAGNGSGNIASMRAVLKNIEQVHIAAIFNDRFVFDGKKNHHQTRKNFVWFGSSGAIHKGLDILIDVFRGLPDLKLDIYGATPVEMRAFDLPANVHDCGFVNVRSDEFIENVVKKHSFVVSISCSEAFQSSVSTCMAHGLIPVVTPETGFDDVPGSIMCDDYHVDYIANVLSKASQMPENRLVRLEKQIYEYTRTNFSVDFVDKEFCTIMNKLLER